MRISKKNSIMKLIDKVSGYGTRSIRSIGGKVKWANGKRQWQQRQQHSF